MDIEPVEATPRPEYPDKYAKETRQLLFAARPHRWAGAPLLVGALSATVALGLGGCSELFNLSTGPTQTSIPIETHSPASGSLESIRIDKNTSIPPGTVIPLFRYGEGTGAIGCVMVAAPVFLSEEEAFAVLAAAFDEAGLTLDEDAFTLKNAKLPAPDQYSRDDREPITTTRGKLSVDGVLGLNVGVPVEFVSIHDMEDWQKNTNMWSSVSVYRFFDTAQVLSENNPGLIVFYDPAVFSDFEYRSIEQNPGESDEEYHERFVHALEQANKEARDLSEQLLRDQAVAFIKWLDAEGSH